jgi:hypothetical protein
MKQELSGRSRGPETAGPAGRPADASAGPLLIFAPWLLYILNAPSHWPSAVTVTVAAAGVAAIVTAWIVTTRRRRAIAERYLGASGTGGLGPRGIRVRQDAIGTELRARFGPEVAKVATRGAWRLLAGRALFYLSGVVAFASLAVDATSEGGAATACLVLSVALCVASIAATLTGMADSKAATASARSQHGGAPGTAAGISMPSERYMRWCEEQGRQAYPFGRVG